MSKGMEAAVSRSTEARAAGQPAHRPGRTVRVRMDHRLIDVLRVCEPGENEDVIVKTRFFELGWLAPSGAVYTGREMG